MKTFRTTVCDTCRKASEKSVLWKLSLKWLHHLALKKKTIGLDVLCCVYRCWYPIPEFLVVCVPDSRVPCVCVFTWCNCDPMLWMSPFHTCQCMGSMCQIARSVFALDFQWCFTIQVFGKKMGHFRVRFLLSLVLSKINFWAGRGGYPFKTVFGTRNNSGLMLHVPFEDSRLHLFHYCFLCWFEGTWLPDGSGSFTAAFINKRLPEKEGTTESKECVAAISCFRKPVIVGGSRF